jgi:biotin transporter BioY
MKRFWLECAYAVLALTIFVYLCGWVVLGFYPTRISR